MDRLASQTGLPGMIASFCIMAAFVVAVGTALHALFPDIVHLCSSTFPAQTFTH